MPEEGERIVTWVLYISILVISGLVSWWVFGLFGLTLLIPILIWMLVPAETPDEKFLKGVFIVIGCIPFVYFVVLPTIWGWIAGQLPMVWSDMLNFLGTTKKQMNLFQLPEYKHYLGVQDTIYEQSTETYVAPNVGFDVENLMVSPTSTCYGGQVLLSGIVKNTGTLKIEGIKAGFYLDPNMDEGKCGKMLPNLKRVRVGCSNFVSCLSETGQCLTLTGLKTPECGEGEIVVNCHCYKVGHQIDELYPNELRQITDLIDLSDPGLDYDLTCRIYGYAATEYHVKSRLEVTFADQDYMLLKQVPQVEVPAVQSYGPVKLKLDIGQQPISTNQPSRILQVALGNEGNGDLLRLGNVYLFIPRDMGKCEGENFECYEDCSQIEEEEVRGDCLRIIDDYYPCKLTKSAKQYVSYTCLLNFTKNPVDLGGENRKSYVVRADAFYDYIVRDSISVTGEYCG